MPGDSRHQNGQRCDPDDDLLAMQLWNRRQELLGLAMLAKNRQRSEDREDQGVARRTAEHLERDNDHEHPDPWMPIRAPEVSQ